MWYARPWRPSSAGMTGRKGWLCRRPIGWCKRAPSAASLHHDSRRRPPRRGLARDLLPDLGGDVAEGLGIGRIGVRHGDRAAVVRGLADRDVERHFAEKIGAKPLGFAARAAMAEDLAALAAMRAEEIAHVLDDAEHRHIDLLEHGEPLARVDEGDVLR